MKLHAQKNRQNNRLQRHFRDSLRSIKQFQKKPFSSLAAILVVMLTLLFPSLSATAVLRMKSLVDSFSNGLELIAYIYPEVADGDALEISKRLLINKNIISAELTTSAAALKEFSTLSGLGEIAASLPKNPLPASITITPATNNLKVIEELTKQLKNTAGIQAVESDLLWSERINSWYQTLKIFSSILSFLSLAGLALIFGSMAYIEVHKKREEFQIIHVIGGGMFDMMRPLLYTGFFSGFAAGALAYTLHTFIVHSIDSQLSDFYEFYGLTPALLGSTSFYLPSANPAILIISAALLSWAASFIFAFYLICQITDK